MIKVTDEKLLDILKTLFNKPFVYVLESDRLLHFYFDSPYGLTACSYNKLSIIKIIYKD